MRPRIFIGISEVSMRTQGKRGWDGVPVRGRALAWSRSRRMAARRRRSRSRFRNQGRGEAGGEPSSLAGEDDQLPPLRLVVVAQDVLRAIVASDLEGAVVGAP